MSSEESKQKDRERNRKWREENKEKMKEYSKRYYEENKEKLKEYQKSEHIREKNKERCKKYREENLDALREYDRERSKNGKKKESNKRYREKNKEKLSQMKKEWAQKNKDRINERRKEYRKDPFQKINLYISNAIREHLRDNDLLKENRRWESLVGYTAAQLMVWLESKFTNEMTWDNYGSYWHIDHIRPKSWFHFDSYDDEDFKKCWALENLQPLDAKTNISKNNKYEG